MADIIVVGGGVGGLCAAIRCAVAGHHVTVLERNEVVGGKLGVHRRDGFSFDTGPSLLTLPHVFDEVLRLADTTLATELDLVRLNPQVRYHWVDGTTLDACDDPAQTEAAFERFAPGSGARWRAFDDRARSIWTVAERTFLAGAMDSPRQLLSRLRSPRDLLAIDPLRTLQRSAAADFDDARLQQWAGRYATYSGSSPYRAPATLACIEHVESAHGAWYPMGGLGQLRDALVAAAERVGVVLRTGAEVVAIAADDRRVRGVRIAGDSEPAVLEADVVVANVDAVHLYRDLLPDRRVLRRVRRARPSGSGFVVLAGVRGHTAAAGGLAHHNVWFSPSYRREYDALDAGRASDEPTIYTCVSSVTDASQAPTGDENWFVLVNTPPGGSWDAATTADYRDLVLRRLAERGVDLGPRLAFTETITPADLASRYRAEGGSIYGTSSDGRRAAFARPGNRGPRRGLYLVGGSSHPGGGLPLVAISGRIVSELIAEDGWT